MDRKELVTPNGVDKDTGTPHKKSGNKKSKKTRRVTNTRRFGIQNDTVEIKPERLYEEYIETLAIFDSEYQIITCGDDGNLPRKPSHSNEDEEETSISIRDLKKVASIGMSKGCNKHSPFAVIDPEADMEVISGVGWNVLHFYNKSETPRGALNGMGSKVLPSVDVVTAVEDSEGRIVLLGIGNSAYGRRTN